MTFELFYSMDEIKLHQTNLKGRHPISPFEEENSGVFPEPENNPHNNFN
jgi:hypothetical protein